MKIIETRRSTRVMHSGHVVSELPNKPGPTNSVFDVMAAVAAMLVPEEGTLAMLGFAAGGLIAPLRALGSEMPVEAVDLDVSAVPIFRRVAGAWAGDVSVEKAEASAWLRARRPFAGIIEDLSQQIRGDVVKPKVSYSVLPKLIVRRLSRRGVAILNFLPDEEHPVAHAAATLCAPYRQARAIVIGGYENQILVAGPSVPPAADLSRRLRQALRTLGSKLSEDCRVRSLPTSA